MLRGLAVLHTLTGFILVMYVLFSEETRAAQARVPSQITGKDGAPMVLVPAGEFVMGLEGKSEAEGPSHRVFLDAFYIDKFEVTTNRYALFLQASPRKAPSRWSEVKLSRDANKPVAGVNWDDALAYCLFYGKRLPTEAEWEKAARGPYGYLYPWGNSRPTNRHGNFGKPNEVNDYTLLSPVGAHKAGRSPFGADDMAGNVWEWVADWYDPAYYRTSPKTNPLGPQSGSVKVIRGGSWNLPGSDSRGTNRFYAPPNGVDPFFMTGFRCAQEVGAGNDSQ